MNIYEYIGGFTLGWEFGDVSNFAKFGCKLLSNFTETPSKHRQKNR